MADKKVTIRTKKFIVNRLLNRKQMILEVIHPGRPNVSRKDINAQLAAAYKSDPERVSTFGMRTAFGGGKSTGFALIYDSKDALKKFEPTYRQTRAGLEKKEKLGRKQRKERKNRAKKFRGTKKAAGAAGKKKK